MPVDGALSQGRETIAAYSALKAGLDVEQMKRGTRDLMGYANRVGLTTVFDESGIPFPGAGFFDSKADYAAVLDLWRNDATTVRIRLQFSTFDDGPHRGALEDRIEYSWFGFGDDMLRVVALGEHVVTFPRDGVVNPAYGAKLRGIAASGWPHEQHSTSDAENRQHIAAIEAAHAESPIMDLRWSLTHVFELRQGGDLSLIERLTAMGMGVRVQNQGYTVLTHAFPLGRVIGGVNQGPLYRTLVDAGIPLGAGTDGSLVGPMNPWLSLYYMVTGKDNAGSTVNAGETLSRFEALRLYTIGSAWFSFDEERLGSIESGKLADLVVLNADYLTVPEEEIRSLRSVLTLVGGKVVFAEGEFAALDTN